MKYYLQRYFPLYNKREYYRKEVDSSLRRSAGLITGFDDESVEKAISQVFADDNMDDTLLHQRQLTEERKQDERWKIQDIIPDNTFLDPILKLCRDQGIQLFLVRVKRRRDLMKNQQGKGLVVYMDKLKNYLDNNNIPILDYTEDSRIEKQHFGHGDHLNRQSGRALSTAILADDLRKILSL